jgi:hypothetical protein
MFIWYTFIIYIIATNYILAFHFIFINFHLYMIFICLIIFNKITKVQKFGKNSILPSSKGFDFEMKAHLSQFIIFIIRMLRQCQT